MQPVPIQPQLLGVSAKSKLQLAKPLTAKARRIIENKTSKLIKKRNEVDAWLRSEANRGNALKPTDYLPREHYVKLDDALARREARHLHARTKALEERERLYKWDPSTERKIDVDLLTDYLFKFKRHLGSYLPDRELPLRAGERDDDCSSAGSGDDDTPLKSGESGDESSSTSSDDDESGDESSSTSSNDDEDAEDGGNDEADGPSANPASPATTDNDSSLGHSSESDSNNVGSTNGDKETSRINMDGAFDDHVQKSNKRKVVNGQTDLKAEQGQCKKVKKAQKEQAAPGNNDKTTLGSQSLQSSVSEVDGISGNQASIDSMPQSKKLPRITINSPTDSRTSDETSVPATSSTPTCSIPTNSAPDDAAVVLPWYILHARRGLEDDFDDCVTDIPQNSRRYRRKQPKKQPKKGKIGKQYEEIPEYMAGALATSPRSLVRGGLPTPQTSSSPTAQSPAAGSESHTARTPPGASSRKTKPHQRRPTSLSSSVPHNKARLAKASTQMTGN